jgi:threonyl-tRNA synthetase
MLEEARKRDHRKLGREMELFCFDEDVGPGLPLWLPKGGVLIEELEKLAKETEFSAGYQRVRTPHIARESMYRRSGHLTYYADSMFPPMELMEEEEKQRKNQLSLELEKAKEEKRNVELTGQPAYNISRAKDLNDHIEAVEQALEGLGSRYYLKAMNCPHHHKIFGAVPRSYRELPLRLAEYGNCYRYEQSGELFGLMRVRSMQMNDAHLLRGAIRG